LHYLIPRKIDCYIPILFRFPFFIDLFRRIDESGGVHLVAFRSKPNKINEGGSIKKCPAKKLTDH
jgi:hypothetical protein